MCRHTIARCDARSIDFSFRDLLGPFISAIDFLAGTNTNTERERERVGANSAKLGRGSREINTLDGSVAAGSLNGSTKKKTREREREIGRVVQSFQSRR